MVLSQSVTNLLAFSWRKNLNCAAASGPTLSASVKNSPTMLASCRSATCDEQSTTTARSARSWPCCMSFKLIHGILYIKVNGLRNVEYSF